MNSLLTVKEVAERLKVSAAMIYVLCNRGRLPHVRVGIGNRSTIRIEEADLEAYLEKGRAPALHLVDGVEAKSREATATQSPR